MRFNSGYSAQKIIKNLIDETDMVSYITEDTYVRLYNELIELLYGEIIQDTKLYETKELTNTHLEDLDIKTEHIKDVYYGNTQLSRGKAEQVGKIDNIYYTDNDGRFCFSAVSATDDVKGMEKLRIYYNYIPERLADLKTENNDRTIPLPFSFLELVTSKLRGEIYKLLNEDEQSAKWLNDYNNLLENFKIYIQSRKEKF